MCVCVCVRARAKKISFKDYNLPPLSTEKIFALSTQKKTPAVSSETSLKITSQHSIVLKRLLLHRKRCESSNDALSVLQ